LVPFQSSTYLILEKSAATPALIKMLAQWEPRFGQSFVDKLWPGSQVGEFIQVLRM
jgi:hypothetical protein